MNIQMLSKIDRYVIAWAIVVSVGSIVFQDLSIFFGVFGGAVIASINWIGFRWLGIRIAVSANKGRMGFFLALKMAAVLAIVFFVLSIGIVDTLAFIVGLSSLVLGLITHSGVLAIKEGDAAIKEDV